LSTSCLQALFFIYKKITVGNNFANSRHAKFVGVTEACSVFV
jgi:hypothetical protein